MYSTILKMAHTAFDWRSAVFFQTPSRSGPVHNDNGRNINQSKTLEVDAWVRHASALNGFGDVGH